MFIRLHTRAKRLHLVMAWPRVEAVSWARVSGRIWQPHTHAAGIPSGAVHRTSTGAESLLGHMRWAGVQKWNQKRAPALTNSRRVCVKDGFYLWTS